MTQLPGDPYGYDELPYPAAPYPYSNPDHLAAVARLFGLASPPVDSCGVIEFGCADGANLIPLALRFPGSRFVGIDLSARQIESGRRQIAQLQLDNIELQQADIHTWQTTDRFDYAIAHGFYSWTPPATRRQLLTCCRQLLSENGIGFISYNVLPGWQTRLALRQWLLARHPRHGYDTTTSWLADIRASIRRLRKTIKQGTHYDLRPLHHELGQLERWSDAYLRHDLLEDFNEPVSFATFCEEIEATGLRFFAEADLASMIGVDLDDVVAAELPRLTTTIEHREQLLDLVTQRPFRQSLVCHHERTPQQQLGPEPLLSLHVASTLSVQNVAEPLRFEGAGGFQAVASCMLVAEMLTELHRRWPQAATLDELMETVSENRPLESADRIAARLECATLLLAAFANRAATIHSVGSAFSRELPTMPVASPLARLQAPMQPWVTNLAHDVVAISERQRSLLVAADGTRTVEALLAEHGSAEEPLWAAQQLQSFLRQALILA